MIQVRTLYTNVRIHPKRYFDVESQKYIRDKFEKIKSFSLHDVIDDTAHNHIFYDASWKKLIHDGDKQFDENGNIIEKWFTPLDDDWED